MRYLLPFIFILTFTSGVVAQGEKKSNNFINHYTFDFDFFKGQFGNLPQGINQNFFSVGYSLIVEYKIPLGNNHLMLLPGMGVSLQDLNFNGKISYSPNLDTTYITPLDKGSYTKNKMSLTYIEIPIDLRYNSGNKAGRGFMITAGFSMGLRADDFVKTTGEDKNGNTTKVKVYYTKNLLPYRYGLRAKIGYEGFCLFGYYNLTRLFETNSGPQITYYAVGVSLGGF